MLKVAVAAESPAWVVAVERVGLEVLVSLGFGGFELGIVAVVLEFVVADE